MKNYALSTDQGAKKLYADTFHRSVTAMYAGGMELAERGVLVEQENGK